MPPEQIAAWMPYSPPPDILLKVHKTQGCNIILEDGRALLDGTASWWTMCHGYSHPYIIEQMQKQLSLFPHVMFSNFASDSAITLAQRLAKLTGCEKILYAESGSSAVDAALKISMQFSGRSKFGYFSNSYHGETLATIGVSDAFWQKPMMDKALNDRNYRFHLPRNEQELAFFRQELSYVAHEIAAIIIEPLAQCAGGMIFHTPQILSAIYRITKELGILFIADEVAVGFYRVGGTMFACQQAGFVPDMMVIGKALTGGHCGSGVVAVQEHIFQHFVSENKTLMHGTTFMGNPVVCAAANASLDLFEQQDTGALVNKISGKLSQSLGKFLELSNVVDVRILGAIGVIELNDTSQIRAMRKTAIDYGVWLRPFANILYILPPLIISEAELTRLIEAAWQIVSTHESTKGS